MMQTSKILGRGKWLALMFCLASSVSMAQEPSDAELAKKAQNPIANMISVPLQNNTNFGIGPYNRNQNVLNIQPVLPASLGSWNLINQFSLDIGQLGSAGKQ
jgi:hypothetical protein